MLQIWNAHCSFDPWLVRNYSSELKEPNLGVGILQAHLMRLVTVWLL